MVKLLSVTIFTLFVCACATGGPSVHGNGGDADVGVSVSTCVSTAPGATCNEQDN